MTRRLEDWLTAYVRYASVTEAPKRMHFWSGVSAIAGALRRRVWIDMKRFMWYPSFYIIFVAPPGIVAKSTTADIAMDLLRQVPGVRFGPNSITWQALVTAFTDAGEFFEYPPGSGDQHPMSPLTLVSSELGSLVNLQDRDMVNLLIELWDGKRHYEKITKMSGNDLIEGPWINMIGCTTPHWIADNMPISTVGGGLSSRCVFLYADKKESFIALVDEMVDATDQKARSVLINDLEHIFATLVGPFTISPEARDWERERYKAFWISAAERMDDQMIDGYAARKQTHLMKLSMVLSASRSDERTISLDDLQLANTMLEDLEADMPKVFARIGRTEESLHAERFIAIIHKRGVVPYDEAYRLMHAWFPDARDFEGIISGAVRSGQIALQLQPGTGKPMLARVNGADVIGNPLPTDNSNPQPGVPDASTETRQPNG